jgi:hypothetical protein
MSAFEDYCIVCEKVCEDGSAYCSEKCKLLDQEHSHNSDSPTLSECSGLPSVHGSFSLQNTRSHTNSVSYSNNNSSNTIPTIISPLLTPQIIPRGSIVSSIKSPNLKDLTYESPLLATSIISNNQHFLNDLDSNRLDLNDNSISQRLSKSFLKNNNNHNHDKSKVLKNINIKNNNNTNNNKNNNSNNNGKIDNNTNTITNTNSNNDNNIDNKAHSSITNVSNLLHSSSENYKKWLSIH